MALRDYVKIYPTDSPQVGAVSPSHIKLPTNACLSGNELTKLLQDVLIYATHLELDLLAEELR